MSERIDELARTLGREPPVWLWARAHGDRDVFAAANLGAVWALHFDHDRHGVARLDALGNEDVDLVEAHAGGLEDRAEDLRFHTTNENPDDLVGEGDNTRRRDVPVGGSGVTGPRPLHQSVTTPPIAAGWPTTGSTDPGACAHESAITSSSGSWKFVTMACVVPGGNM